MNAFARSMRPADPPPTADATATPATGHDSSSSRRRWIGAASAAVAGVAGAPAVFAQRSAIRLRMQTAWPARDIFHEFARDLAAKVAAMSGGRLHIDILPAGTVVKAFDVLDAVSRGVVDMGHGTLSYWTAKNAAFGLWGSGPAFGMDANTVLAWHEHGGGRELLGEIYKGLEMDVQSFLYGPMPPQPLGWFRKPIQSVDDLKGLRFRTVGLAGEMLSELGMRVNSLPATEIVTAIDRGQLDAAEFNNATSDRALGFPEVARYCLLGSFHQTSEQFEVLVHGARFRTLPADLKAVLEGAVRACSAEMSWKAIERYSKDYDAMRDAGVQFLRTPESILEAQLKAWETVVARRAAQNPLFARVAASMERFARRACRWTFDTAVDHRLAFRSATQKPRG